MLLCEAIEGRVAQTRVLTEADAKNRGFEKRTGILGYVEGVLSVCDIENKNGRVYERALWEGVLEDVRYRKMVEDMTLLGEPDHPETRTQSVIREGSHTIVEMHLDGNFLRGTVAIFDNALGRIVWPMLQAGVKLGFSTRGDGDLVEDRNGKTRVDRKTYEYHGVDFVLNPSFVEAKPESITESTRTQVRRALTEAVESKKLNADEELQRTVEALFESAQKVESTPVSSISSMKGLESVLAQLEKAHDDLSERGSKIVQLEAQIKESRVKVDAARSELEAMRGKAAQLGQSLVSEQKARKEGVERYRQQAGELKKVLVENQRVHAQLVGTHRKLQEQVKALDSKYRTSVTVIESLRARLQEAQTRVESANRQVKEAQDRADVAKKTLDESLKTLPERTQQEVLKKYKSMMCETTEVPEQFRPLIENARSEAEVDTVIESVRVAQAARYPFLPIGPNLDSNRRGIANSITEKEKVSDTEKSNDYTVDGEDVARVIGAQLRRSR